MRLPLIAMLLCVSACRPTSEVGHPSAPASAAQSHEPAVAPPTVVAPAELPTPSSDGEPDTPLVREADDEVDAPTEPELRVLDSGLGIVDLRLGTGAEAKDGDRLTVHYVGTLDSGESFDSSRKRQRPFSFELGSGLVIAGWDEGIVGMRVGGLRRLLVPPTLGYGSRGVAPSIPPNAILEFEIELLSIDPPP